MPYISDTKTGEAMVELATRKPPFGMGCTPEEVKGAVKLQVLSSSFSDPGEDWNQFQLIYEDGTMLVANQRGY
jgi:hypothetical protein